MNYVKLGKEHNEVVILLHGGGLCWWNYREAARLFADDYRVILPILDGHAGSDTAFTTIEQNAAEIIAFVDEHLGGSVLLMNGLSLGGQVLLEILSQRRDICKYALIESALAVPSRLLHALIRPAFGSCYGLIEQRWFAKLQFRSLGIKADLFEDYCRDSCAISKPDMIAFLQANAAYTLTPLSVCGAQVRIVVGEKENRAMRRSAQRIHNVIPGSWLQVLPGMHHGDFSLNHAEHYAKTIAMLVKSSAAL